MAARSSSACPLAAARCHRGSSAAVRVSAYFVACYSGLIIPTVGNRRTTNSLSAATWAPGCCSRFLACALRHEAGTRAGKVRSRTSPRCTACWPRSRRSDSSCWSSAVCPPIRNAVPAELYPGLTGSGGRSQATRGLVEIRPPAGRPAIHYGLE
jgi:hypothetical protein